MTPPPRILVIYAHAAPHRSRINRKLAQAAQQIPNVHLHDLYETYPDFHIDVANEQALLAQSDLIVFLHPIQWYSMPSLLKEWIDTVLEFGWAYGTDGTALQGKGYWLVVTTGSPEDAYRAGGAHDRPFDEYLHQFRQTAKLCGMDWVPPHILHGAHQVGNDLVEAHVTEFSRRLESYPMWVNQLKQNQSPLPPTIQPDRLTDDGT